MIEPGIYHTLEILRTTSVGFYLGDEYGNEVLFPNKYITEEMDVGNKINVFIYLDSEDRPVATSETPFIKAGEYAYLRVKDINRYGAFLDWGLEKDLMVPYNNQAAKMEVGKYYITHLYLDEETDRLVGTSKINKHLNTSIITVKEGEEVDLLICGPTELGVNVVINNRHKGLIYHSDIFKKLLPGDALKGYIKEVREDKKIDVVLEKPGYSKVEPNAQKILTLLKESDGFIELTDKSDPDTIKAQLQMSKKVFKQALGSLYKQRLIRLEKNGTYLS